MPADRPLHYYNLGVEVLRDVYTLACCDALICGISQVSFAARYVNLALCEPFREVCVIDHGILTEPEAEAKERTRDWGRKYRAVYGKK